MLEREGIPKCTVISVENEYKEMISKHFQRVSDCRSIAGIQTLLIKGHNLYFIVSFYILAGTSRAPSN